MGLQGYLNGYEVSVITLSALVGRLFMRCCCRCILYCSATQEAQLRDYQYAGRHEKDKDELRASLLRGGYQRLQVARPARLDSDEESV